MPFSGGKLGMSNTTSDTQIHSSAVVSGYLTPRAKTTPLLDQMPVRRTRLAAPIRSSGDNAGLSNTTETDNTFIGANSIGSPGITNATAVGANATVTQSDSLVLGDGAKVGIGTTAPKKKLHVNGGDVFISSGRPRSHSEVT